MIADRTCSAASFLIRLRFAAPTADSILEKIGRVRKVISGAGHWRSPPSAARSRGRRYGQPHVKDLVFLLPNEGRRRPDASFPIDRISARTTHGEQRETADDTYVFIEVDHVLQAHHARHRPIMMADHRGAERIDRQRQRERAGAETDQECEPDADFYNEAVGVDDRLLNDERWRTHSCIVQIQQRLLAAVRNTTCGPAPNSLPPGCQRVQIQRSASAMTCVAPLSAHWP